MWFVCLAWIVGSCDYLRITFHENYCDGFVMYMIVVKIWKVWMCGWRNSGREVWRYYMMWWIPRRPKETWMCSCLDLWKCTSMYGFGIDFLWYWVVHKNVVCCWMILFTIWLMWFKSGMMRFDVCAKWYIVILIWACLHGWITIRDIISHSAVELTPYSFLE